MLVMNGPIDNNAHVCYTSSTHRHLELMTILVLPTRLCQLMINCQYEVCVMLMVTNEESDFHQKTGMIAFILHQSVLAYYNKVPMNINCKHKS